MTRRPAAGVWDRRALANARGWGTHRTARSTPSTWLAVEGLTDMADDVFVRGDGPRLAVRGYGGDGPRIVLIHGQYGNLGSFDHLAPLLTGGLRVVAYDQRGHGWSEPGPISTAAFAKDLSSVVDALGLDRPILYGSSFGTLVGLAYLLKGGAARAFITEDGQLSDFPEVLPEAHPPPEDDRVLDVDAWQAYLASFSTAGRAGEATAHRSAVRRPDGKIEILPSGADIFAKEHAFARLPIRAAYQAAPGPVLALLARRDIDLAARQAEVEALAESVDLETAWFECGHWISAEMTEPLADLLLRFCTRRA